MLPGTAWTSGMDSKSSNAQNGPIWLVGLDSTPRKAQKKMERSDLQGLVACNSPCKGRKCGLRYASRLDYNNCLSNHETWFTAQCAGGCVKSVGRKRKHKCTDERQKPLNKQCGAVQCPACHRGSSTA